MVGRTHILLLSLLLALPACKLSCLAPKANPLDAPIAAKLKRGRQQADGARFDHAAFDTLLSAHVRADRGRVDYASLKQDEPTLDRYLAEVGAADLGHLGADQQKALLINAYNAFTLKLILEHYPGIDSIKNLDDPWGTRRWIVGDERVSLDDIEHGLLRPVFKDPRIHFAVNCASIGCPPLSNSAYTGDAVDDQLEAAATKTLHNPRYAAVDGGELHLTKLLQWYGPDFTKEGWSPTAPSIPQFVARYGSDDIRALVADKGAGTPVKFVEYDWNLNDVE
jgi:hypothetical protein